MLLSSQSNADLLRSFLDGHSSQKAFRSISTSENGHTETDADFVQKKDGQTVKKVHKHTVDGKVTEHTVKGASPNAAEKKEEEASPKKAIKFKESMGKRMEQMQHELHDLRRKFEKFEWLADEDEKEDDTDSNADN